MHTRSRDQQEQAKRRLAQDLLADDPDSDFARGLLLTDEGGTEQSRFGPVSALSPQCYQQSVLPHGFAVLTSGIQPAAISLEKSIPPLTFFRGSAPWIPEKHLKGNAIVQVSG